MEGDLEVVPRLGYLNRTSSLSWLAVCDVWRFDFFPFHFRVCTLVVSLNVAHTGIVCVCACVWFCDLTVTYGV